MRRIKLKRNLHINIKRKNIFLISLVGIFVSILILLNFMNKKLTPILMEHAEVQAKRIILLVTTEAISTQIDLQTSLDELFIIVKNDDNSIKSIDYNPVSMNKLLTLLATNVRVYLQKLENGKIDDMKFVNSGMDISLSKLKNGVISEIPSGVIFGNTILSNLGPKIPVKLNLVGDILVDLKTNVTNYGINNALIELTIHLEIQERVILPFQSKAITVSSDIPLSVKFIEGTVPNYYYNGNMAPSISLPT